MKYCKNCSKGLEKKKFKKYITYLYSTEARVDNPRGDKLLIITKMFYYFYTYIYSICNLVSIGRAISEEMSFEYFVRVDDNDNR